MTRRAGPVRIGIDRVVLDGVDLPAGQVAVLVEALTAELHRRVRDGGHDWRSSHTVRVPALRIEAGRSATEVGRQAGEAVHRGLTGDAS